MMKRPLEDDEEDSSMKRARGDGPRIELRILLQSKVIHDYLSLSPYKNDAKLLKDFVKIVCKNIWESDILKDLILKSVYCFC